VKRAFYKKQNKKQWDPRGTTSVAKIKEKLTAFREYGTNLEVPAETTVYVNKIDGQWQREELPSGEQTFRVRIPGEPSDSWGWVRAAALMRGVFNILSLGGNGRQWSRGRQ